MVKTPAKAPVCAEILIVTNTSILKSEQTD